MSPMLKRLLVVVLLLFVAACAQVGNDPVPELTEETAADLAARALAIACEQLCVGNQVPVHDLVYAEATSPLQGEPLTDLQRRAVTQQFNDVIFVSTDEVAQLVSDGGVALAMGPVTQDAESITAEVAAERSDGLEVVTQEYRWNGDAWVPVPA
jgi:hypothetical protein